MQRTRIQSEGNVYHIMNRGCGLQIIYEDNFDKWHFLKLLEKLKSEHHIEIFAWCLMSNHFHLLISGALDEIANFQRDLCSQYAYYFNKKYARTGHLFQSRYKSEAITDDAYLIAAVRYIHANPEKAGICKLSQYPWSSYSEYMGAISPSKCICETDFVLSCFGGRRQFYQVHQQDQKTRMLDIESTQPISEQLQDLFPGIDFNTIKSLPKKERNDTLRKLRNAKLPVRQIERLTGIGRGIIQDIKPDKMP